MKALPPGTQQFNCILVPSGHMMIPCAKFPMAQYATNRGVLQLTPELALPVEIVSDSPPWGLELPQRVRAGVGQQESV